MTQKTKLEILGPYTPEHEGPYLFNGEECLVHGTLGAQVFISHPESDRGFIVNTFDIRNAGEVPVAREFWLVKHDREINQYSTYVTERAAQCVLGNTPDALAIIHVREVLPGEGA